jgi:hypothetical protein
LEWTSSSRAILTLELSQVPCLPGDCCHHWQRGPEPIG